MEMYSLLAIICSKSPTQTQNQDVNNNKELTIKTSELHQWLLFNVFMSSDIALMSLILTATVTLLLTYKKNEDKLRQFLFYSIWD